MRGKSVGKKWKRGELLVPVCPGRDEIPGETHQFGESSRGEERVRSFIACDIRRASQIAAHPDTPQSEPPFLAMTEPKNLLHQFTKDISDKGHVRTRHSQRRCQKPEHSVFGEETSKSTGGGNRNLASEFKSQHVLYRFLFWGKVDSNFSFLKM